MMAGAENQKTRKQGSGDGAEDREPDRPGNGSPDGRTRVLAEAGGDRPHGFNLGKALRAIKVMIFKPQGIFLGKGPEDIGFQVLFGGFSCAFIHLLGPFTEW
jgi:hypothetical protein